MSFGQAFATAFLNGLTGQILENRKTAKEERLRKERIAETAGLQQYLKRQANFTKYKNIAQSLINTYNADKESVVRLATNPLLLAEADAYIKNFSKKFPNAKITKKRIDGFLSSLDLVMPEEYTTLSADEAIQKAARKASGLAIKNTNLDAEKKDSSVMENNFFLSALGFGADEKEDLKLRQKAVGQGFNMYDLYTMGVGGDYVSPDQATGRLDYSYFPDPLSVTEQNFLQDNLKSRAYDEFTFKIQELERLGNEGRKKVKFADGQDGNQKLASLTTSRSLYKDDNLETIKKVNAEFGGKFIGDLMIKDKSMDRYLNANLGALSKDVLEGALQYLYNDSTGIRTFTEEEILNKAESLGFNLVKTASGTPPQKGSSQQINNQNVSTNQQPPAGQIPVPTQQDIDELLVYGDVDDFVTVFTVQGLPAKGPAKPRGAMNVKAREWNETWGKYYNSDGTKK
tara:strand:+ start:145 stop:1515 length:1371 start_codon:yes stop_codon:yes gene_type:complete